MARLKTAGRLLTGKAGVPVRANAQRSTALALRLLADKPSRRTQSSKPHL